MCRIRAFTRHYHAMHFALAQDLIAILPRIVAMINMHNPDLLIMDLPFMIPKIELEMLWGPLVYHDTSYIWFRRQVIALTNELKA